MRKAIYHQRRKTAQAPGYPKTAPTDASACRKAPAPHGGARLLRLPTHAKPTRVSVRACLGRGGKARWSKKRGRNVAKKSVKSKYQPSEFYAHLAAHQASPALTSTPHGRTRIRTIPSRDSPPRTRRRRLREERERIGTPGGNRTPNQRIWNPLLYQLSYGRTDERPSLAQLP